MDGGAWWATAHGVAKRRTRLSDFTFTFVLISYPLTFSKNWQKIQQIHTTSHAHCAKGPALANWLRKKPHPMKFVTLTNYHPASPTYPYNKVNREHYRIPGGSTSGFIIGPPNFIGKFFLPLGVSSSFH